VTVVTFMVAFGVIVGITFGSESVPGDLAEATSPQTVLSRDRRAAILLMLTAGIGTALAVGVAAGLVAWVLFGGAPGVIFGLLYGVASGVVVGAGMSTGQAEWPSYLITIGWLTFRHQLPWSPMRFLADAHQRGILRQAGAVYQFRHIELQRRLANRGTLAVAAAEEKREEGE